MNRIKLEVGDVVQVRSDSPNFVFRNCLVIVKKPSEFGCHGTIPLPGEGRSNVNLIFEEIEWVGRLPKDAK